MSNVKYITSFQEKHESELKIPGVQSQGSPHDFVNFVTKS